MTMKFSDRCAIATGCLPKAEYRTRLEALHAEMLAALAAQGEPVAWMTEAPDGTPMLWPTRTEACQYCDDDEHPTPLYAAPKEPA